MPNTKNNDISPRNQVILSANHNYFIRTTIVIIARIVIAASIFAFSTAFLTGFASGYGMDPSEMVGIYILEIIAAIAYIVYFFYKIAEILRLYRDVQTAEDRILKIRRKVAVSTPQNTSRFDDDESDDEEF